MVHGVICLLVSQVDPGGEAVNGGAGGGARVSSWQLGAHELVSARSFIGPAKSRAEWTQHAE